MRGAFIKALVERAREDKSIVLMTGDLGYSVLEDFQAMFPTRFINAGVAEQNMIGMAAGLARSGFHVFVYSIGNFLSFRAIEQIRNDVYYPSARVTMVGVGGGFDYGSAGFSLWMIEDLAPLSALERLPVFVPCTEAEVKNSVNSALKLEGPSYIRLARQERVPALREKKLGQFAFVKAGVTHLFLTYGSMSSQSFFAERADEAAVVSTDCLYPINVDLLCRISNAFSRVTVVEDHVWAGGLGSRLSKLVACGQLELEFDWMGVESPFDNLQGGKANYLQRKHGLDSFRSSKEWTNGNC